MFSGICPFARGILYLVGQTAGAALAGGLILGSWGEERTMRLNGGGCFFDPAEIGAGRVFLTEVYSSFTLVFLSFGVGLDPRQAVQFGTKFSPLLVGLTLGLIGYATTGIAEGWTGAGMNPARCFGVGVSRGNMKCKFPGLLS